MTRIRWTVEGLRALLSARRFTRGKRAAYVTWWDDQDMAELLSDDQLNDVLPKLPDWAAQDAALVRTVELESFAQAIMVVNRIAEIAENDNHHPDIDIRYKTLTFRLSTHYKGGITALDVSLAEEIDGVLDALA
jgi:4a-hydroxytetrahydrobiopterin dehydratase